MNKTIFLLVFILLSVIVYAQQQVSGTNQGIANARPGDYIIRSNGQRVVLNQGDIDYARGQLGMSTNRTNQNRLPQQNTYSPNDYSPSSSSCVGGNFTLIIIIVLVVHIIITICIAKAKGGGWAALYFFLAPLALFAILGSAGGVGDQSKFTWDGGVKGGNNRTSKSSTKYLNSGSRYKSRSSGTCGAGLGCSGGGGTCGAGLGCSGGGVGSNGRGTCGAGLGCSGGGGQCGAGLGCGGR